MTISLKVSYFRNVLMQKTRKRNTKRPHTIMCNKSGSLFVFFVGCKLKYSFFCKMSFKSCRLECSSNEVFLSEEGYWLQFEKECCNFRIENFMLSFFLSPFSYINMAALPYLRSSILPPYGCIPLEQTSYLCLKFDQQNCHF